MLQAIKTKQPMGVTSYDSALREMFKPRAPRQNLLRKAYVNHWYRKELSFGKQKQIAERMRHSVNVALGSYRKVGLSEIPDIELPMVEEKKERPEVASLPIVESREPKSLPKVDAPEPASLPILVEGKEVAGPPAAPAHVFCTEVLCG